jgi:hypothetical protein
VRRDDGTLLALGAAGAALVAGALASRGSRARQPVKAGPLEIDYRHATLTGTISTMRWELTDYLNDRCEESRYPQLANIGDDQAIEDIVIPQVAADIGTVEYLLALDILGERERLHASMARIFERIEQVFVEMEEHIGTKPFTSWLGDSADPELAELLFSAPVLSADHLSTILATVVAHHGGQWGDLDYDDPIEVDGVVQIRDLTLYPTGVNGPRVPIRYLAVRPVLGGRLITTVVDDVE